MLKAQAQSTLSPYYPLAITRFKTSFRTSNNSKKLKLIKPNKIRIVQYDRLLSSFLPVFVEISKNARQYCHIKKDNEYVDVLKLLDEIIPKQFYGTVQNRRLFYKTVKLILTHSVHECIYKKDLIRRFDLKAIPWLAGIAKDDVQSERLRCKCLFMGQQWLLERIVKPAIVRFYAIVKTRQRYQQELVPKGTWQRFRTKAINLLLQKGHIQLIPDDANVEVRAILQVCPKNGFNDFKNIRPIVRLLPEQQKIVKQQKRLVQLIEEAARKMCRTMRDLYNGWRKYAIKIKNLNLYAVKIDVQDAFGTIDIDLLCKILEGEVFKGTLSVDMGSILIDHIKNQNVIFDILKRGRTIKVGKWNHGLLQGDRLSPALSHLYMSHIDSHLPSEFYDWDSFLHRTTDDYFFCSTDEDKVRRFIERMSSIYTLNNDKTESNISEYGHDKISYCGRTFILNTKEVAGLFNFKTGTDLHHRFKLWNAKLPIRNDQEQTTVEIFLRHAMKFCSSSFYFANIVLNTIFNTEETVIQNYFESMIFVAFKFDRAFMAIYYAIKDFNSITGIIKEIIHDYSYKTLHKINAFKGEHVTQLLSFEFLLRIGFQAFILVLEKRFEYKKHKVLDLIKKKKSRIRVSDKARAVMNNYTKMPKTLNNISMARELPHKLMKN